MPFQWTCPFCDRPTTITTPNVHEGSTEFRVDNAEGKRILQYTFVVCPNPECRKFSLTLSLFELNFERRSERPSGWVAGKLLKQWSLIPSSKAKPFPSYVPVQIIADYNEACLIAEDSPKAAATLARRCLQGIIRDYWAVKAGRLVDEIDQIKGRVDPLT